MDGKARRGQQALDLATGDVAAPRNPDWRACLVGLWTTRAVSAGLLRALARCRDSAVLCGGSPDAEHLDRTLRAPQRACLRRVRADADVAQLCAAGRLAEAELVDAEVRLVVLGDDDYPGLLDRSGAAPGVLSVAGSVAALGRRSLAIVGTRRPTAEGMRACRTLIEGVGALATRFVIVSGGALGIDGCAHRAALAQGLATVVVSATGVDEAYPPSHRAIFREAVERGGAVVSQFPPRTPPRPSRFPRRNPTIAGLAEATVVVEAPARSGALQTAAAARRAGRAVWVIPGPPFTERTAGGHGLIKAGEAGLLDSLVELSQLERGSQRRIAVVGGRSSGPGGQRRGAPRGAGEPMAPRRDSVARPPWQRRALTRLEHDGVVSRDALLATLGESAHGRLLELELAGLVRRVAGDRYRLAEVVGRVEVGKEG